MNINKSIQMFLGAEGIKEAYEKTLKASTVDIVCLSDNYEEVLGNYFGKEYSPKLYNSSIKTREILPDTQGNREYAKSKNAQKNQVHFLTVTKPSESDMMFFGDQAILVSYNKVAPFALLISDADIVGNMQNQFNSLWESLGK